MVSMLRTRNSKVLLAEADKRTELFRDLYTRVLMTTGVEDRIVLGVTSPIDGEGKTTIATELASMLARDGVLGEMGQHGGNILLFQCNNGQPVADQDTMVAPTPGLIHYLQHECALDMVIKPTGIPRLAVLPTGGATRNLPILIRSSAMPHLLHDLRERFDLVILDLPSVLTTTDTQVLAGLADYLLLVVRSGVTPTKLVTQALETLEQDKLVGLVLNDRRSDLPSWLDRWL